MLSDLVIARSVTPRPIQEIAAKVGLGPGQIQPYGHDKAKILVDPAAPAHGRLVLVSAMTPTPAGEGKTTVSVGLADAMARIGEEVMLALREPSLGPVLGRKGGAAGGGYSQVIPMEDINLHFTGDLHAVTSAHNLLAAMLDHHLQNGNPLQIEQRTATWKRVLDLGDRALREVLVGMGGPRNGFPRQSGFDITAASEVMAILCMARDVEDLRHRLGNIVVGRRMGRGPAIRAKQLDVVGAMMVLLKDALRPNLVQTLEGTPALIHGGPFANIAQGTNTILATRAAMGLADWTITEAGFGFDLGGEKFLDLKCPAAGISPSCVVMVATVRALKVHGGVPLKDVSLPSLDGVRDGLPNLEAHLDACKAVGLPVVVAVNRFGTDTDEELQIVLDACADRGVPAAVSRAFEEGGEGAEELARLVVQAGSSDGLQFEPVQKPGRSALDNLRDVATTFYGAKEVVLVGQARKDWRRIQDLGLDLLPVCVAKTPASLSDDPRALGRPEDHTLHVRSIEISAGAGFLVPITGSVLRMPGMPKVPGATRLDLDGQGQIVGLS